MTFDITEYNSAIMMELQKFERSAFNVENILATAERLKYIFGIKQNIQKEMEDPSNNFVRLACSNVYEGQFTTKALEMLTNLTKNAFREVISDAVKNRLSSALQTTNEADQKDVGSSPAVPVSEIITTDEEMEGFLIVKAIACGSISSDRIVMRDAKSYCAILVDDNNRKPLVRLHFNKKNKQIELFDDSADERVDINNLDAIYEYSDRIRAAAEKYIE